MRRLEDVSVGQSLRRVLLWILYAELPRTDVERLWRLFLVKGSGLVAKPPILKRGRARAAFCLAWHGEACNSILEVNGIMQGDSLIETRK
jgi:hypothetical protein